jgi:PBSX family phage terminase large subunit
VNVRLTDVIGPGFYDLHHDLKAERYGEVWLKGGRGSLKSSFISVQIVLGLMRDKDANAVVCRRYENEIRDTVFSQIEWAANVLGVEDQWHFAVSPMQAVYLPTGQRIVFKGADQPKKTKSIKIAKGYVKFAWFEEVDQYGGMDEVRSILQSLFRGGNFKRVAFFSYNPPRSSRSWVNQEVRIPKPGRCVHFSTYLEAPPEWLGERFIADAEHLQATNEMAYRHEYLGEEVGTGLEIFNNVKTEPIPDSLIASFDKIRQGLDFGFAVDPLAFEKCHYDAKHRRLYVFKEISGIGISNRQLADRLSAEEKYERTIADSAEPKSIHELKVDYGLNVVGVKKGPGSVEHGVKWLSDLNEIIIDNVRCPVAAKEFVNYALEQRRDGEIVSRYPDKENHAIDSVRYALADDIGSRGFAFVS